MGSQLHQPLLGRLGRFASCVAAVVTLAGCKTGANASATLDQEGTDGPPRILLVVAGGWVSCATPVLGPTPKNMFLHAQAMNLVRNLKASLPGAEVSYLLTCTRLQPPLPDAPLWYLRSDAPTLTKTAAVAALPSLIEAARAELGADQVYLLGHSYGGWQVMQALASGEMRNVRGVFTIDPISAAKCRVVDNLPLHGDEEDCTRAPTTLDTAVIRSRTLDWLNIYQSAGSLHSSAIPAAENDPITLPYGKMSHHRLGFDNETWTRICARLTADAGGDGDGDGDVASSAAAHCATIDIDENGHLVEGGLTAGVYRNGECAWKLSGTASALVIDFTACSPHPPAVRAELGCANGQCAGHLLRAGLNGAFRRLHPLANDAFVRRSEGGGFDYLPFGPANQQGASHWVTD
jgi:pimeloyl-ACP methyl ester carboxylesterase